MILLLWKVILKNRLIICLKIIILNLKLIIKKKLIIYLIDIGGLYQWALTQQNQRFEDRERLNSELFGVYIDGRNRTDALIEKNNTDHFNLYKYTRDADDDIRKELSDLKAELAVTKAIRPYQDKLIQCEMEKMFTAGINYTDRKTCNVIYGVVTLPNEPTVTGLVGRNACGCLPCGFTQPASGTPAQ